MSPTAPTSSKAPSAEYSLLDHLSSRKPMLQATPRSRGRTNTMHQLWLIPSRIVKWQDFDCASLTKCCNGIFYEMLQRQVEPMKFPHLEDGVVLFADEAGLERHYISQWVLPIVKTALSHAQSHFNDCGPQPPFVQMVSGGNAQSISGNKPDWAGTRAIAPYHPNQTANILPGDSKVGYKWRSKKIVPKQVSEDDFAKNWFWPLRQIFTYCMNFKTRYGYIISDEEVVAFRVREPREQPEEAGSRRRSIAPEDTGTIEYMPIYACTQGPGSEKRLTMNLAIWWLHLLAANDRSIQTTYGPLKDEIVDGLGTAPTPLRQSETPTPSEATVKDRASPATTIRTYDVAAESDAINSPQSSTYGLAFSSLPSPAKPFTPMHYGTGSARPKRKRDGISPEAGVSKKVKSSKH